MKKVQHHSINMEIARRNLGSSMRILQSDLTVAQKNPVRFSLDAFLANLRASIGCLAVAEPDSPELCHIIHLTIQATTALYAVAATNQGTVTVTFENEPTISVPAKGPGSYAGIRNWYPGFFCAMICRDTGALDALAHVPIELLRHSGLPADECQYLFADTLQGMWKREKDVPKRLLEAVKATNPSQTSVDQDYILNMVLPTMELLYNFLLLDKTGFNTALEHALLRHKQYWSNKERTNDPFGYLALGPLALASFAYDINFPIEVESEYLPMRLVRGDCRQ